MKGGRLPKAEFIAKKNKNNKSTTDKKKERLIKKKQQDKKILKDRSFKHTNQIYNE